MSKLTKYNSYEALKADTNRTVKNEQQAMERHLSLKQVLEQIRSNYLMQKQKEKEQK